MHALKTAWVKAHGKGSVVGLAPSAVAAQVLAEDLGIACENTAKWLHEHDRGRAEFLSGQLVIIDEATLAGTLTLDRLTALAAEAGAKVLLVGDWAQLQSVDAGGAFSLLASARPDTPELTEVHRFTHEWEKTASLDLRFGRAEVIGTYVAKDRVREGTTDEMMDAAYLAWTADVKDGRTSILVAEATDMVIRLNRRARADRIVANPVGDIEVNLADGTQASEGDLIITRHNDRRLHTLRGGWVRNGDRWTVTRVHKDGSMQVQRLGVAVGGTVTLPAAYVAEHVDLGYAVTAHRAQGMTVDTSHVVVTGSTTRENFYVSMTRGRDSNIAYVALDKPDEGHAPPEPDEVNAHTVLYGVLQHIGGELSAHQMIAAEQDTVVVHRAARCRVRNHRRGRPARPLGCSDPGEWTHRSPGRAGAGLGVLRSAHRRTAPGRGQPPRRRPTPAGPRRPAVTGRRRGHRSRPDQPTPEGRPAQARQPSPLPEAGRRPDPRRRRPHERGDGQGACRARRPDGSTGDDARREGRRGQGGVAEAARHGAGDRRRSASLAARGQDRGRLPRPLPGGGAQGARRAQDRRAEARRRPR